MYHFYDSRKGNYKCYKLVKDLFISLHSESSKLTFNLDSFVSLFFHTFSSSPLRELMIAMFLKNAPLLSYEFFPKLLALLHVLLHA